MFNQKDNDKINVSNTANTDENNNGRPPPLRRSMTCSLCGSHIEFSPKLKSIETSLGEPSEKHLRQTSILSYAMKEPRPLIRVEPRPLPRKGFITSSKTAVYTRKDSTHMLPFNNLPQERLVSEMGRNNMYFLSLRRLRTASYELINLMWDHSWFETKIPEDRLRSSISILKKTGVVIRPGAQYEGKTKNQVKLVVARNFCRIMYNILDPQVLKHKGFSRVYDFMEPVIHLQSKTGSFSGKILKKALEDCDIQDILVASGKEAVKSLLEDSDLRETAAETLSDVVHTTSQNPDVAESLGGLATSVLGDIADRFTDGVKATGKAIKKWFKKLWEKIVDAWRSVTDSAEETLGRFQNWIKERKAEFIAYALALIETLAEHLDEFQEWFLSGFYHLTSLNPPEEEEYPQSGSGEEDVVISLQGKEDGVWNIAGQIISSQLQGDYKKHAMSAKVLISGAPSLMEMFKRVYRWMMYVFTGDVFYRYKSKVYEALTLTQRARMLIDDPDKGEKSRLNVSYARDVEEIYEAMCKLQDHPSIVEYRVGNFLRDFSQMRDKMGALYRDTAPLRTDTKKRITPIFMVLQGRPGCGKSTIIEYFNNAVHRLSANNPESVIEGPYSSRSVYTKVSEYWEGYGGQPIYSMPELFAKQNVDERAEEGIELLKLISSEEYMCDMAFDMKGKIAFNSDFVIATSNLPYGQYGHLGVDANAIKRRITFPLTMYRRDDIPEGATRVEIMENVDKYWYFTGPSLMSGNTQFKDWVGLLERHGLQDQETFSPSEILTLLVNDYERRYRREEASDGLASISAKAMDAILMRCGMVKGKAKDEIFPDPKPEPSESSVVELSMTEEDISTDPEYYSMCIHGRIKPNGMCSDCDRSQVYSHDVALIAIESYLTAQMKSKSLHEFLNQAALWGLDKTFKNDPYYILYLSGHKEIEKHPLLSECQRGTVWKYARICLMSSKGDVRDMYTQLIKHVWCRPLGNIKAVRESYYNNILLRDEQIRIGLIAAGSLLTLTGLIGVITVVVRHLRNIKPQSLVEESVPSAQLSVTVDPGVRKMLDKAITLQSITDYQKSVTSVIAANVWTIHVVLDGNKTTITNRAVAVKGNVLLTSLHEFKCLPWTAIMLGGSTSGGRYIVDKQYVTITPLGDGRDACFLTFDPAAKVALMQDITCHFASKDEFFDNMHRIHRLDKYHRKKAPLLYMEPSCDAQRVNTVKKAELELYGKTYKYECTNYYRVYSGKGEYGDCGLPYVHIGNKVTFFGIHFGRSGDHSTVIPIFREDLEILNVIHAQSLVFPDYVKSKFKPEISSEKRGVNSFLKMKCYYDGTGKTEYVRSLLGKAYDESSDALPIPDEMLPAVRRSIDNTVDNTHSPYTKADKALYLCDTPSMPTAMYSRYKTNPTSLWKGFDMGMKRIKGGLYFLEILEALNGLDKWVAPMKRNTSTGLLGLILGIRDRHDLWNEDWVHPDLLKAIEEILQICRNGDIPGIVFLQSLKDEILLKEKVLRGDCRAFAIGDIAYLVCMVMTFGVGMKMTKANGIYGAAVMGFNPHSVQARYLWDQFDAVQGENWMAADMKNMDNTVPPYAMTLYIKYWTDLYGVIEGSPEYNQIFGLLSVATNAFWMRGNSLYATFKGHFSGWLMTSHYNSFWSYVCNRFIFNLAYTEEFNDCVVFKCHGDDIVAKVSAATPKYNMVVVSQLFKLLFGMIMTKPDKSEIESFYLKKSEVDFLGRSPGIMDNGVKVSPLRVSSLYGMLLWVKKDLDPIQSLNDNVQAIMLEATMHDRLFFEEIRQQITCMFSYAGVPLDIKPWEFYMNRMIRRYTGGTGTGITYDPLQVTWGSSFIEEPDRTLDESYFVSHF